MENHEEDSVNGQIDDSDHNHETKYLSKDAYEGVPPEIASKEDDGKILKISDLKKIYDNGFKAVNGVNLKMYSD